ncbi:MAG TPA: hypothetical protein VF549_14035 [Solirubrobacteraceae bacterium]
MVTFIALLMLPAPALAQDPAGASPSPSVDQYRESVPTAGGSKPSFRGGKEKKAELPPDVKRDLAGQAGADAQDLEAIATDPGLGAPADPAGGTGGQSGGKKGGDGTGKPAGAGNGRTGSGAPRAADERSVVPAAAQAVGSGSDGMVLLLLGLGGTTAVVAALAFARRRPPTA